MKASLFGRLFLLNAHMPIFTTLFDITAEVILFAKNASSQIFVMPFGILTHFNDLSAKAALPIFTTFTPPIVGGITTCFGPLLEYHVIVPLLLLKVKYDSSVRVLPFWQFPIILKLIPKSCCDHT
ncbi:hypothetical protein KC711_04830 [Candidatus Peregrinibacteria bacterium]|nr:hypothetical protein [Candidatus Peregrinibacteria bacterium]